MITDSDITICIASGHQVLDFKKFLYRVYCLDLHWHDAKEFPDGIFIDPYDTAAFFLNVYANDQLISGVRLVHDSALGYPHEYVSHVSIPNIAHPVIDQSIIDAVAKAGRAKTMEITRFIGDKSAGRIHTYDLMKAMYWFCQHNGVEILFMTVDLHTFLQCEKLGFKLIPVGIPFFCEGSWVIPAVQIVCDMVPATVGIREYFLDTSALVGNWRILSNPSACPYS